MQHMLASRVNGQQCAKSARLWSIYYFFMSLGEEVQKDKARSSAALGGGRHANALVTCKCFGNSWHAADLVFWALTIRHNATAWRILTCQTSLTSMRIATGEHDLL